MQTSAQFFIAFGNNEVYEHPGSSPSFGCSDKAQSIPRHFQPICFQGQRSRTPDPQ
jgi:hypothetical protein